MASDPLTELLSDTADRHSRLSRARDYVDRAIELTGEAGIDAAGRVAWELTHARDVLDAKAGDTEAAFLRLIAGGPS